MTPMGALRGPERRHHGRRLWDRLRRRLVHVAYMALTLVATATTYGITDAVKGEIARYWAAYAAGIVARCLP